MPTAGEEASGGGLKEDHGHSPPPPPEGVIGTLKDKSTLKLDYKIKLKINYITLNL